jgi:hypothetical protein
MNNISVLDIKLKALQIRSGRDQTRIRNLEAFLDIVPEQSNYLYENRVGLFGFSAEFLYLTGYRRSHSTLRQHIGVENLIPQCEVTLTDGDYQRYQNL